MIYMDNSATTRPHPEVADVVRDVMETYYGNPSSLHHKGLEAERILTRSRENAARQLGVGDKEVVFTSGGTEGNNAALKGAAFQFRSRGRHLITTKVEHASVYQVCRQLEAHDFEVTYLPVDEKGCVSVQDLKNALREDTILVSVMHVNNEIGSKQPVKEIGQLLQDFPKTVFHVDAVQSFGKEPLNGHADLMTLSGHKFHGPRGAGLLYVREGLSLEPLIVGGGQEGGFRSGTSNLPAIVGLVKAMRMEKERMSNTVPHLRHLQNRMKEGLRTIDGIRINTPEEPYAAPHIVNASFPGIKAEALLHGLEEKGVMVSTKSACSSKAQRPSRVLTAIGCDEERASSGLRFSFSRENTVSEVDHVLEQLKAILPKIQMR